MKYRAEIDGLRAISVVPIILFHAGFELFSGGFVGVDVFFVISGYLITTIIVEDIANNRFSIVDFYERRARRILPALFFMMIICIPFAWSWMLPDPLENFGQSLVATVLFSNNILLLFTSGYWDLASEFKPLLHTWSLGVEEQYYLFFPLFLMFVWRFAKSLLLTAVITIAVISLALSENGWREYPSANFYLIFTRAWELFAGSAAALIVRTYGIKANNWLSALGLSAVLLSIFGFNERTPFPSLYALVPVIGVVLIVLYAEKTTFVAKFLSLKLLVGIGLISYSVYLWHQPLLSFAKVYSEKAPTLLSNSILVFVTFPVAFLSWRYVETPFRKKGFLSTACFSYSVIIVASGIMVFGYSAHSNHGFVGRVFDTASKPAEMYISYNQRNFEFKREAYKESSSVRLLVIGNSFGRDIVNVIRETYDMGAIDLIYRDDLTDCETLRSELGKRLFAESDVVLFASNYSLSNPTCIEELLKKSAEIQNRVFFLGPKGFGYNLNWIARVDVKNRARLRNQLLERTLKTEELAKRVVPERNYISIIDGLTDENDAILVTDERGRLISGDRIHLTRYGAIYVGKEVMLPSEITSELIFDQVN